MVDDFGVSRSSTESTVSPTFSGHIGWVEFEESDKESNCINCTAEEKVSAGNGQYISRLGEFIIQLRISRSIRIDIEKSMG